MSNQLSTNSRLPRRRGMYVLTIIAICMAAIFGQLLVAQDETILRMNSSHTSFPDRGRALGYSYDSVFYNAADHYSDSSVLILLPPGFQPGIKLDLVFWFHGWNNNIEGALSYYHLGEQFLASRRKAVLVLAETSKNASDSYGGKLELEGMFSKLVADVLSKLKQEGKIPQTCQPGQLILAGHSGAYRVIAFILQRGGTSVKEVELFDALYGEVDKFRDWFQTDTSRRFINWYTNEGGGTDVVSRELMDSLKKEKTPFLFSEETAITVAGLRTNRLVFVHSNRPHNNIIFKPDNFELLLRSSPILR